MKKLLLSIMSFAALGIATLPLTSCGGGGGGDVPPGPQPPEPEPEQPKPIHIYCEDGISATASPEEYYFYDEIIISYELQSHYVLDEDESYIQLGNDSHDLSYFEFDKANHKITISGDQVAENEYISVYLADTYVETTYTVEFKDTITEEHTVTGDLTITGIVPGTTFGKLKKPTFECASWDEDTGLIGWFLDGHPIDDDYEINSNIVLTQNIGYMVQLDKCIQIQNPSLTDSIFVYLRKEGSQVSASDVKWSYTGLPNSWYKWTPGEDPLWDGSSIEIPHNQTLFVRGDNPQGHLGGSFRFSFFPTAQPEYIEEIVYTKYNLGGSIMGLIDNGYGTNQQRIPSERCFSGLFAGAYRYYFPWIGSISENFLPATDLHNYCYSSLFHSCKIDSLPPKLLPLPVDDFGNLPTGCYSSMFSDCTGLTAIPSNFLPATERLGDYCYYSMFANCKDLTTALNLSHVATFGGFNGMVVSMFQGCENLCIEEDPTNPDESKKILTLNEWPWDQSNTENMFLDTSPSGFHESKLKYGSTYYWK